MKFIIDNPLLVLLIKKILTFSGNKNLIDKEIDKFIKKNDLHSIKKQIIELVEICLKKNIEGNLSEGGQN